MSLNENWENYRIALVKKYPDIQTCGGAHFNGQGCVRGSMLVQKRIRKVLDKC